jgi:hypothetical protein
MFCVAFAVLGDIPTDEVPVQQLWGEVCLKHRAGHYSLPKEKMLSSPGTNRAGLSSTASRKKRQHIS